MCSVLTHEVWWYISWTTFEFFKAIICKYYISHRSNKSFECSYVVSDAAETGPARINVYVSPRKNDRTPFSAYVFLTQSRQLVYFIRSKSKCSRTRTTSMGKMMIQLIMPVRDAASIRVDVLFGANNGNTAVVLVWTEPVLAFVSNVDSGSVLLFECCGVVVTDAVGTIGKTSPGFTYWRICTAESAIVRFITSYIAKYIPRDASSRYMVRHPR